MKRVLFYRWMKARAGRDGAQTGKSVMVKWLEPHKDCAAGSRLEINTVQIDNAARAVLDQLCKQKTFAVRMPEAHDSFLKAFRAGADAGAGDGKRGRAHALLVLALAGHRRERGTDGELAARPLLGATARRSVAALP